MNKTILKETKAAYSDCNKLDGKVTRNLNFRASEPVSVADAVKVMSSAIDGGYNEFEPRLLKRLPKDSQVTLAREGSVCVYVRTAEKLNVEDEADLLKADEVVLRSNGEYRMWWD